MLYKQVQILFNGAFSILQAHFSFFLGKKINIKISD